VRRGQPLGKKKRVGQPLGKKKRVVLPSCVVSKIWKTFLDPDGIYEGFHDVDSSSFSDFDWQL
jgi:hypothetical protein